MCRRGEDEGISAKEGLHLCAMMEKLGLEHTDADGVNWSVFQQQLRRMRGHLRRLDNASQRQVTLDSLWAPRKSSTLDIAMS